MQKVKFKIPIHNLKFRVLILLFPIFLISFLLFSLFSSLTSILYAQCLQSDLNEGLISAVGNITGNTGNINQICVTGTNEARYREFKVPTYDDLENQFYTLSRSSAKKTGALPGSLAFAGDGIYLHQGNLTINTASGNGAQIIFVHEGNLDITGNITYADADSLSGLVFVVQGDVNIYDSVTQINAVLISTGDICTAFIAGSGCPADNTPYNITPELTVNGSLISLNTDPDPITGKRIKLRRNLIVNDQPAEKINKQAKYLYILRNGMFTKDLIIITEDSHYDIPGVTNPPPPVIPPLPPAVCTPVIAPQEIPIIFEDIEIPECLEFTDS